MNTNSFHISAQENRNSWTTRETVVISVSSVVFGMLYLAWVQLWLVAQGVIGPLAMDIVFGFWFAGSVFNTYVIRKPFVALATALIASLAEVLTGNPAGAILLLTGVIQGAGSELPFLLTRWRRYSVTILALSSVSAAVFSFVYNWVRFDYQNLEPGLLIAMFVIRITSGVLLGSLLPLFFASRLRKTGVFSGLAIDTPRRG
ncbi:MAG: ECF transporter S component [Spirochaeta sp.]|jgi:energy-coupling factor transport system substrate-specific component|nr:ECF transporter S component [Spirochaeta sp.]